VSVDSHYRHAPDQAAHKIFPAVELLSQYSSCPIRYERAFSGPVSFCGTISRPSTDY